MYLSGDVLIKSTKKWYTDKSKWIKSNLTKRWTGTFQLRKIKRQSQLNSSL